MVLGSVHVFGAADVSISQLISITMHAATGCECDATAYRA